MMRMRLLIYDNGKHDKRSVIEVEHIQSGNNCRVSSLEEANQWMQDADKKDKQPGTKEIE